MEHLKDWQVCNSETFWCEVGCCSHVVQLYESEEELLSLLEDFVAGGVLAEDCIVIIATAEHLNALEHRLWAYGLDVDALRASDQYIAFDANQTLPRFMVQGRPDRALFQEMVDEMFARVQTTGRKMRSFGEMVALLWGQGNQQAAITLEQYWNELFETEAFPLFCAYHKDLFSQDTESAVASVCNVHSKIISPIDESRFDVSYQDID